ncbi:MAG: stage III sporulation AC/AD family protein [Clostridiales bacterium]|nr:stage III sporulation AC/AD family protein [Clostridiales bacterium]
MKITSLLAVALFGTALTVLLKQNRPEQAWIAGLVTALLLIGMVAAELTGIVSAMETFMQNYGVRGDMLSGMAKVVAIAWLAQFGVQAARDAGQSALAAQLETGGRVLLLACALPSVFSLLQLGAELIGRAAP